MLAWKSSCWRGAILAGLFRESPPMMPFPGFTRGEARKWLRLSVQLSQTSIPRLRAGCEWYRVVHDGKRRLRRTNQRVGQLGTRHTFPLWPSRPSVADRRGGTVSQFISQSTQRAPSGLRHLRRKQRKLLWRAHKAVPVRQVSLPLQWRSACRWELHLLRRAKGPSCEKPIGQC